jgi:hypothetical protein
MTETIAVVVIAAIATFGGIWLGIVVVAPRMARLLDRPESTAEEPGDRPD